jgi:hypothetical protein
VSWSPESPHRAATESADPRPDLVDLAEAGRRLGANPIQIRTLMQSGRFPRPHYRFGFDDIWCWPHISAWFRSRNRRLRSSFSRRPLQPLPVVDLVDLDQIARRLSLPTPVLRVLRKSGRFPEPDYRWAAGEAWLWETARAWAEDAVGIGSEPSRGIDVTRDPPVPVRVPLIGRRTSRDRLHRLDALAQRLAAIERSVAADRNWPVTR